MTNRMLRPKIVMSAALSRRRSIRLCRQCAGKVAADDLLTKAMNTATWQFSTRPALPQSCRETAPTFERRT